MSVIYPLIGNKLHRSGDGVVRYPFSHQINVSLNHLLRCTSNLDHGEQRWLGLFGQVPADFKWIPAGFI
ncbi:hypothetical protein CN878_02045 [Ochrobactrum sp. 695/2009]|nr:hypothetical protein CN881_18330 [Ochrobactrum sp. 721/2009]PJT15490.1 hypothetical protein CN880_13840 [Ochrobactrum sp. 720/2009]PJT19611.1 hypothetical protein CN879_19675 [Ochrobactrum sp. 715/2009]PJT30201.1 hypothetical protein CN878_02045 [Ochrobactrum sp. 695/2009]PJT32282.1 hypothetical protein CN877_20785 [Ochrobactrum sp. 689/2009]